MTYLLSDAHGEYTLLRRLLDKIKFSATDSLYVLGDMIDKGEESVHAVDFLQHLPNATCILGNHEYDFLKRYWALTQREGVDFDQVLSLLKRYFPFDGELLSWEHIDWLESLPCFVEKEDWVGVHAGIPLSTEGRFLPWKKIRIEQLVYDRAFKDCTQIADTEKCVFFGHTPVRAVTGRDEIMCYYKAGRSGNSVQNLQKVHLDLGVYLSGVFGCYCLEEGTAVYVRK